MQHDAIQELNERRMESRNMALSRMLKPNLIEALMYEGNFKMEELQKLTVPTLKQKLKFMRRAKEENDFEYLTQESD